MTSDIELDAYIDDVNDLRRRLGEAPLQLDSSEKSTQSGGFYDSDSDEALRDELRDFSASLKKAKSIGASGPTAKKKKDKDKSVSKSKAKRRERSKSLKDNQIISRSLAPLTSSSSASTSPPTPSVLLSPLPPHHSGSHTLTRTSSSSESVSPRSAQSRAKNSDSDSAGGARSDDEDEDDEISLSPREARSPKQKSSRLTSRSRSRSRSPTGKRRHHHQHRREKSNESAPPQPVPFSQRFPPITDYGVWPDPSMPTVSSLRESTFNAPRPEESLRLSSAPEFSETQPLMTDSPSLLHSPSIPHHHRAKSGDATIMNSSMSSSNSSGSFSPYNQGVPRSPFQASHPSRTSSISQNNIPSLHVPFPGFNDIARSGSAPGFLQVSTPGSIMESSSSVSNFIGASTDVSLPDDDEFLVYVTEERPDLVAKKKPDLESTYMCDSQLEGEHMTKYREVLDAFNKPQLEALLRMMDEIIRRDPSSSVVTPANFQPSSTSWNVGNNQNLGIYVTPPTSPTGPAPQNPFPPTASSSSANANAQFQYPTFGPGADPTFPLNDLSRSYYDNGDINLFTPSRATNGYVDWANYATWRQAISTELLNRHPELSVKNWSKEFQRVLAMPRDDLQRFSLLRNLGQDFVFTAETYGRIIISEMHLPPAEKTIKPVKIGGIAGGHKYICQGILFKFAVDTMLEGPAGKFWMYGGTEPCTEFAMKAAKHDLRGVLSLTNLSIPELRSALVALIDYRGFRLIAQSLLPINKTTLQYGSDDGGKTFVNNPKLAGMMRQACERLNLKPHRFKPYKQSEEVEICGPADIEGHIGEDGQIYVVDLARLMPPEAPQLALIRHSRSEFFNMLRPELVKRNDVPLSCDACTSFGKTNSDINNKEVESATLLLQQTIMPEFAEKINTKMIKLHNGTQLGEEMHRAGLNLRYLGFLRAKVNEPKARSLLLLEMILRVLKNKLRHKLRSQMERTRISIEAPYARVVLHMLNLVLFGKHKKRHKAKTFWTHTIKHYLRDKYVAGLTDRELDENYDLKVDVDMQRLLDRFQVLTGVKLIPSASIYRRNKSGELIYTDIAEISAVTHHMNIVNYAEGSLLLMLSRKKKDRLEKLRLLNLAEHKLRLAKASSQLGIDTIFQLGNVYYENTKVKLTLQLNDVMNAIRCYQQVINNGSTSQDDLQAALLNTLKLFYRHVKDSVWVQRKLFRKKVTHASTMNGDDNIMPADIYFVRLSARLLDKLQKINRREASRFIKSALIDQGCALTWALQLAELSVFASSELIQRLCSIDSLDIRNQPQLFMSSVSGKDLPTIVKVFFSMHEEKAQHNILAQKGSADDAGHRHSKHRSSSLTKTAAALVLAPSSSISASDFLLPSTKSLTLSGCTSLTTETLSALLKETPLLEALWLDDCARIGDELALLLRRQDSRPALKLQKLSIANCHRITDLFFNQMSAFGLLDNLRVLQISGCRLLTNVSVWKISKAATRIEDLRMNNCSKISDIMLFGCSKLRKLEVRETAITDTELRDFLSLSCTQKEFKELDISGNKITDESFAVLTQTSKPLQLQKLHLSDTTIGTATLRILNQIVTGLTDLDLGLQEKLDRDDIVRIGEVQTRLRKLKIVNGKQGVNGALLTLEHQLNPPSLESIELPWCSIRDLMIHGLSKTFRTLQAIDLTGCHEISNHTLMGLRQVSTSLTYLNLSWCSQLVDHTMVEILRECPNITRLSLAHCAQLTTNALEEIPRGLVSLDVSHCLMFALLGKMPARCLHLKEINLACVTIPSKELRVLFSFGISLNTLNLKGVKQVDNQFVRKVSKYCPLLKSINLDECTSLDDIAIVDLLSSCKYLQHVLLPGVRRITDFSFTEAARSGGMQFIKELNLSGCRKLTDVSILAITDAAHQFITSLNLSGLCLVTSSSVIKLVGRCQSLNSLNLFGCNIDDEVVPILTSHIIERLNVNSTKLTPKSVQRVTTALGTSRGSLERSGSAPPTQLSHSGSHSGGSSHSIGAPQEERSDSL